MLFETPRAWAIWKSPFPFLVAARLAQRTSTVLFWISPSSYCALCGQESSNAHPVAGDKFLREIIDPERNGEEDKAHHEKGPVMRTAADDLTHFLRDDSGHRVHGLKDRSQSLGEIWNRDPVSGAQKNDHGFADDATQPEKYRRDDAGER